ncbi:YeiH family protein [Georgenia faecalis]|uniref:YeiH family protein n=1 Tax=Georgenia faecalis TaxID=2483799 RepID=A0ABV9DAG4_9MICO|nr:putative sulfate exporter family transporter [Georgenia faecalis]
MSANGAAAAAQTGGRPSPGQGVWRRRLPGLVLVALVALACLWIGQFVPVVSPLILAIVLGIVVRNAGLLRPVVRTGTEWSTKRLLRAGVVLLGLQLSVGEVLSLRPGELVTILATVVITFATTWWLGSRIGTSRTTSLLIAAGFSICGASAVAAMSAVVPEDETSDDDVATSIAMVTLFGALALFLLPALQGVVGLDDHQMGVWIGASVHEVAQVVAAASAVSAAALTVAVVVKLGRVVLLAPMVALVGGLERRRAARTASRADDGAPVRVPPLVPLFVLGFLAMVVVRSLGVVPEDVLERVELLTRFLLTAAMFGLGTGVHLATLRRTGGRAVALGAASTLIAATVSLVGIHTLA